MKRQITCLILTGIMVAALLLVSCVPVVTEDEEAVVTPEEEVVTEEEEEEVALAEEEVVAEEEEEVEPALEEEALMEEGKEVAPPEETPSTPALTLPRTPPELYVTNPSMTAVWSDWYIKVYKIVGNRGGAGIVKVTLQETDAFDKPKPDGQRSTQYIYLDKGEAKKVSFKVYGVGWQHPGADLYYTVTASPAPVVYIQGKTGQDSIPGLSRISAKVDIGKGGTAFGPSAIWLMDSDGSNQKKLADGSAPKLSPDGKKIAFISDAAIWVMDSDGGYPEQLGGKRLRGGVSWSPDGEKMVFVSGDQVNYYIWVMDSDGSNQKKLTKGGTPSWSPDGRKIAFVSAEVFRSNIWVMDSDGSNKTRLTDTGTYKYANNPSWSPDGRKIAFTQGDSVRVMNSDGSGEKILTGGAGSCWSPDGEKIAFVSKDADSPTYNICVVDSDGSNLKQLTTNQTNDRSPSWSPDGQKIAFTSRETGTGLDGGIHDIWVMGSDGSNKTQLTTSQTRDRSLSWSPDGQRIIFSSEPCSPALRGAEVDIMFFDEEGRIIAFENIQVNVTVRVYTRRVEDSTTPEGEKVSRYVKDKQIWSETVAIDDYRKVSLRLGGETLKIPFDDVGMLDKGGFAEVIVHTSKGDFEYEYGL